VFEFETYTVLMHMSIHTHLIVKLKALVNIIM